MRWAGEMKRNLTRLWMYVGVVLAKEKIKEIGRAEKEVNGLWKVNSRHGHGLDSGKLERKASHMPRYWQQSGGFLPIHSFSPHIACLAFKT